MALGQSVNISCLVDASPANVSFFWHVDGDLRSQSSVSISQPLQLDPTGQVLQYRVISLLEYGVLRCLASNSIGKATCHYYVIPKASEYLLNSKLLFNVIL